MPKIASTSLQVNVPLQGKAPDATLLIVMDPAKPMPVGAYTFQLEVIDDSGNRSQPVQARLFIVDTEAPSAIISAPRSVAFGSEITLSGAESRDVGGGTISTYVWTLIQ